MIIYFAGNTLLREREMFLLEKYCSRLYSFYSHKEDGMASQDFILFKEWSNENISSRTCRFRATRKSSN
jgi:hypothetical protein